MDNAFINQLILGLAGGSLEITRNILEIAKQNLAVNTKTLEVSIAKNETEGQILEALNKLIDLTERTNKNE